MKNLLNKPINTLVSPASIKNGDHGAFVAAYHFLHIKTFRFFLKKVYRDDLAKELTQQTFTRLWQLKHTLSEKNTLEQQVFVIAHSLLINHFEQLASQQEWQLQKLQVAADTSSDHYSAYNMFELYNRVNTAIGVLPLVRKKILVLRIFHDNSSKETARQLEISVKTVEDHITRAFRRMKEIITLLVMAWLLH